MTRSVCSYEDIKSQVQWGRNKLPVQQGCGARGSVVVKALCCKSEGRGFASRGGKFFSNLPNPSGRTMALGSTQPLTRPVTEISLPFFFLQQGCREKQNSYNHIHRSSYRTGTGTKEIIVKP
jgi:hypothetical protein